MPITEKFKTNCVVKYEADEIHIGIEISPKKSQNEKNILRPSGAAIKNQKIRCLTFQGLGFLSPETLKCILKV